MGQTYDSWCDHPRPRQAFHVSVSCFSFITESKFGTLFSDTNSFIYAIKSDDVYRDLEKIKADFDFSNYDDDHFLFEDTNKKVMLKFKDEIGGKPIREFIALKPKLNSVFLDGK